MLVAAGFKVITPKTAAQQQRLKALPPDKVTSVQRSGKTYYVFPDFANNQAYVGGPKQYQEYRQLRLKQTKSSKPLRSTWTCRWTGASECWGWDRILVESHKIVMHLDMVQRIVLDITMPRLDGIEAARQLLTLAAACPPRLSDGP